MSGARVDADEVDDTTTAPRSMWELDSLRNRFGIGKG